MADVDAEHTEAGHGDSDNFDPHVAWLVPCKTWLSLRQSWWEEFFSVKAAWTRSSGVLFQYSEFRSFSANDKSFRIILLFLSLEFLNFNLTIFWGISHFEKLTALKSSWYDGNEVMIRWMSNSCYMESCQSLVISHFKVSPGFKTFQGLSTTFGPFFILSSCFSNVSLLELVRWGTRTSDPVAIIEDRDGFMVEKGARQSDTRHQTLAVIMRVPGVIARSSKSWGFRVKKTLRISWMAEWCAIIILHKNYHMESSNPLNLRIPLASSLGCASSGSERAFYGQGCYFAELAQHLRVEIIPFEENATTWNQGRRFGLSVNCMSWVWEAVRDSTVGLGKVFAFV